MQLEQEDDDNDSEFIENMSSTVSLSSSILDYRTLNGREYRSDGGDTQYWFVKLAYIKVKLTNINVGCPMTSSPTRYWILSI